MVTETPKVAPSIGKAIERQKETARRNYGSVPDGPDNVTDEEAQALQPDRNRLLGIKTWQRGG